MTIDTWDQRCRRCGRCCYEKIEHNGRVYYTAVACKHLDLETGCCRIYAQRHRLQPECMPLTPESLSQGVLPEDCPYVADIVDYNKPQLLDEDAD